MFKLLVASGQSEKNDSVRINTLVYYLCKGANEIFNLFNLLTANTRRYKTMADRCQTKSHL